MNELNHYGPSVTVNGNKSHFVNEEVAYNEFLKQAKKKLKAGGFKLADEWSGLEGECVELYESASGKFAVLYESRGYADSNYSEFDGQDSAEAVYDEYKRQIVW